MPKRPVIFSDDQPDSLDYVEEQVEANVRQTKRLSSYIPGYTEQVEANDMAKGVQFGSGGEIHGLSESDKRSYYERFGTEPKPLPYVFNWLRVADHRGEQNMTVSQSLMNRRREGWTAAKKEDFLEGGKFAELGWGMPPAIDTVGPDGTLRRMDTALFYMKGDRYRRLEADKQSDSLPRGPDAGLYEEREGEGTLVDAHANQAL